MIKFLLKVEELPPDKMVLLHDIDGNIIISHPFYLVVYQDEAKLESSTK